MADAVGTTAAAVAAAANQLAQSVLPYTARGGIDREPFFLIGLFRVLFPSEFSYLSTLKKCSTVIQMQFNRCGSLLLHAGLCFSASALHGAVIFESTAMGTPNESSPSMVVTSNSSITQFVGTRFTIGQQTLITSVGGYMAANGHALGQLFAAIVSLNPTTGLPTGSPFAQAPIATTTFLPNPIAGDIRASMFALLNPGTYGLIFGSGLFGSPQGGEAWLLNPGSTSNSTYFAWTSVNMPGLGQTAAWSTISGMNPRFVVEGTPFAAVTTNAIPEPASFLFVLVGLAGLGAGVRGCKK